MLLTDLTNELTAGELVGMLADPHRCFQAYQRLLRLGESAKQAAMDGLAHESAQVREYCCKVLDRLMDAAAAAAVARALNDPCEAGPAGSRARTRLRTLQGRLLPTGRQVRAAAGHRPARR